MIAAAFLCAWLAAPALEVSIAPDQPVPYVYADEPVILQIKSTGDGKATGQVSITDDYGKSVAITLPAIPLRTNGAHWQTLEGAPTAKGRFRVHVALDVDGSKNETDLTYCRIDRPNGEPSAPARVRVAAPDAAVLHALRGIPLREITVPLATSDIATVVAGATAAGFRVTIALDAAAASDLAALAKAVSAMGDTVAAWRVPVPEVAVESLEPLATALHDAGSRGQLEVELHAESTDIAVCLTNGLGRVAHKVFLPRGGDKVPDLASLRSAFEAAGYEDFRVQSIFLVPQDGQANPWAVAREVLGVQSVTGVSPEIDSAALFANGSFVEPYSHVSAMTHRLNGYEYFGQLPLADRVHAVIFRNGGAWVAATWREGTSADQAFTVGDATDIALTDADGNALPAPELEDGSLRMALNDSIVYMSGKDGPLLATTARAAARAEAESFTKKKAFQNNLPKEVIELVKPIAASGFNRVDRVTFFALLRLFPVIEQKWHEGTLARDVAVPAMASLSRLTCALCVIEQDSGEPFIELLQDTLARCGDYQSKYLTSTSGTAEKHERADWLLTEVARLTAQAKALADGGRGIEAVGVASIAEWRARSLEFAKNSEPLGAPEPVREATPPTPAPDTKKSATSKAKRKG